MLCPIFRWGEEEYWRRLEEEERAWEEQEGHRHSMEWGHRIGSGSRSDFMHHDMVSISGVLQILIAFFHVNLISQANASIAFV